MPPSIAAAKNNSTYYNYQRATSANDCLDHIWKNCSVNYEAFKGTKKEKIQIELMFIFRWSSLLPLLDFVQTEPSF